METTIYEKGIVRRPDRKTSLSEKQAAVKRAVMQSRSLKREAEELNKQINEVWE
jgi:hypothetical protein